MAAPIRPGAAFAAAFAVLALAGCGEKSEPDLANAPPPTTTTTTTTNASFQIKGRWEGTLQQKGVTAFNVQATIASLTQAKRNPVHYGGINCAGTWDFLGRSKGAYRFREVIDRGGGGQCKGTGTVTLTPDGPDQLDYSFKGGGVASFGTLERASGANP